MRIKLWSEKLKGRNYSVDLGVDGNMILQGILGKYSWKVDESGSG